MHSNFCCYPLFVYNIIFRLSWSFVIDTHSSVLYPCHNSEMTEKLFLFTGPTQEEVGLGCGGGHVLTQLAKSCSP